jgi:hypothetical protein
VPNYIHITVQEKLLKDKQSFQTLWSYSNKIYMPYQYPNHFSNLYSMYQSLRNFINCNTAKRILERRGIQTSSLFVKIWLVFISEFKANFLYIWHLYGLGFFYLESTVRYIWEKAVAILAGNLNSSRRYLITAVKNVTCKRMSLNCDFVDFVFQTVVVNAEILQKKTKKNESLLLQRQHCRFAQIWLW